ncbi:hypothetical protein EVAR_48187_1 [Eumeta japonica]|uniref:Uncharacterized protein n=1 Tax=Eumeta variegata TaxID=151549 RepID=A0A4C1XUI7_EUMVA|nr:hypothetical protein EVAR_48187_1 [Eumeta japonica]
MEGRCSIKTSQPQGVTAVTSRRHVGRLCGPPADRTNQTSDSASFAEGYRLGQPDEWTCPEGVDVRCGC